MYWAMDKEIINIDLNVVLFEITVNCSVIVTCLEKISCFSVKLLPRMSFCNGLPLSLSLCGY